MKVMWTMAQKRRVGDPGPLQPLALDTLSQLADGQAKATINAALAAAVRDTEDRGDDGKPRKVTGEIELKKLGEDSITATIKAKTAVPPYVTKPTVGKLRLEGRNAEMVFSPSNADNPDQRTVEDVLDAEHQMPDF